jgi:uncharacterized protein
MILVDAGPLVALIHAGDQHHRPCRKVAKSLTEPLGTVWPALTEAMYLLGFSWKAQDALWEMLEVGFFELLPVESQDSARMRELMRKYRDLPMDLADAALVAVAERLKLARIFTVDRGDFELYRPARIGRFTIVP